MSQSMAHSMKRFQGMCDSLEGEKKKEKKPVYMHQRMPPPSSSSCSGDMKTASGGKVGG